jgi:hypothetical protein
LQKDPDVTSSALSIKFDRGSSKRLPEFAAHDVLHFCPFAIRKANENLEDGQQESCAGIV